MIQSFPRGNRYLLLLLTKNKGFARNNPNSEFQTLQTTHNPSEVSTEYLYSNVLYIFLLNIMWKRKDKEQLLISGKYLLEENSLLSFCGKVAGVGAVN